MGHRLGINISGEGRGLSGCGLNGAQQHRTPAPAAPLTLSGQVLKPMNPPLAALLTPPCQAVLRFTGVSCCCAPDLISSLPGTRCPEVNRCRQFHSFTQHNTLHTLSSTGQRIQQLHCCVLHLLPKVQEIELTVS